MFSANASSLAPTVLAAFAASLVEFVEALTIVLAVGIVRGWRSPLLGVGAALVLLVALIALLGRSLASVPLPVVQLVVGTLLLMFGLRWLRKAVLRSAGVIALHDETEAYRAETAALRARDDAPQDRFDAIGFATAFKTVALEGVEVVFIVVAIGAGGTLIVPAAVGAAVALLAVVVLGLALHRPLASLPENKLKFGVGVLLSAFGTFWVGEGIGMAWPGGDWAILVLTSAVAGVAMLLVALCRRSQRRHSSVAARSAPGVDGEPAGRLRGEPRKNRLHAALAQTWKLFIDDGRLALEIPVWVALMWALHAVAFVELPVERAAFAGGLMLMLVSSVWRHARP